MIKPRELKILKRRAYRSTSQGRLKRRNNYLYPILILFFLAITVLVSFSASRGNSYADLSGLFKNAFFFDDNKAYMGYANQISIIDLKSGRVKKKHNIFELSLAYQTYPKALFVYKNNIFLRTYVRSKQGKNNDYLFWYNTKHEKIIQKIEISGPSNIVQLKNKNFIVCGDRLINISERKIYQITSLRLDKQKTKQDIINTYSVVKEKYKKVNMRWGKWITAPDGKCYVLLSGYDLTSPNKSAFLTKLYQYNFFDIRYKRRSISNFLSPTNDSVAFIGRNLIYAVSSNDKSDEINVYDMSKGKIEDKIPIDFFNKESSLIADKSRYVYYCSIGYSDNGINYSKSYAKTNVYQKVNILIIDKATHKVFKSISKVFHNEPFNRVSFFCISKGILYLIQDTGLGNDKKIIAIDILSPKKISEKIFDCNFVPQIMTPKKKIIGFENGEVGKVKVVKLN